MTTTDFGELLITIRPTAVGWLLEWPFVEPILFESGAQAERAARLHAKGLARAGMRVVVEIVLRDGRLGGRLCFGPPAPTCDERPERRLEIA
jgi:hypothetical protein